MPSESLRLQHRVEPQAPEDHPGEDGREARGDRIPRDPDAEHDQSQGREALLRHAVQQRRDEDQQQPRHLADGRDVAALRPR